MSEEELAQRCDSLIEALDDIILEHLRDAVDRGEAAVHERRLQRARRALQKASFELRSRPSDEA